MKDVKQPEISIEKLQNCKNALQRQFDFTYPQNNQKNFYIGVSDYVQTIIKSDYLDALVKTTILNDRDELIKQVNTISEKSVAETEATFQELKEIIKTKKIDIPAVNDAIKQYNDYLDGRIQISGSGNFATHLSDYVRDIIFGLKYNGHEDIASRYAIVGETPEIIIGWKISKSEPEVEKLLLKIKEQSDVSIWGAWEALWWVYATIQGKDEIWESMKKSNNTWDRLNFGGLIGEMKEILEEKPLDQNKYHYFKFEKFKRHLSRVDTAIKTTIDNALLVLAKPNNEIKQESKTGEKWYMPESGAGCFGNKKFHLTEGRNKYNLFNQLVKKIKLTRSEVIDTLSLEIEKSASDRSANTYAINNVVNELRKTTGLDSVELINNGGNISLAVKIEIKSLNIT